MRTLRVVVAVGFVGVVDAESRETAVRRTSMGEASSGALRRRSMILAVERAGGGELLAELGEFGGGGQLAEPEQVGGLFEGGALGELVDVDAAIGEDAASPSIQQMEDSLATTSCRPLVAAVDILGGAPGESCNSVLIIGERRKRLSRSGWPNIGRGGRNP